MVHMANQVALFFASAAPGEAAAGVADHLQKYWEPRMRRQLLRYVELGGTGLHELVQVAARDLQVT